VKIRQGRFGLILAFSGAALLAPAVARAETDPKFEFAKAEPPKPEKLVEWKAQAKAGGLLTTGNSEASSVVLALQASRKEGANRLSLEGGLAYGRTNTISPILTPGTATAGMPNPPPTITGFNERTPVTTTNNWLAKGRYDRFFTENNSGYASAQGAGDKIAGKSFFGGAQVGYSRQLVKNDLNLVVVEIGYDYSFESYVEQAGKSIPSVSIHSARLFAGETLKLSQTTGITASGEALFNLNKESKALDHTNGQPGVSAFSDTRVVGKAGLTTTVWKALSIGFGFTLKYDQNPAPLPVPPGVPPGTTYDMNAFSSTNGFVFAKTVDTLTEATLIYTFL
jgi:hypothetical protein